MWDELLDLIMMLMAVSIFERWLELFPEMKGQIRLPVVTAHQSCVLFQYRETMNMDSISLH